MSNYHLADTKSQWFQDNYPGSTLNLTEATMVLGVHTTEGVGWDPYQGGATAPNYTGKPNFAKKRLDWRAHFPDEKSSRSFVNMNGGVDTNTLNVVQVELVGTCDPAHRSRWGSMRAGVDYIYWPEAPEWALRDFAAFVADMHKRHGLRLVAPDFQAYPASYGARGGTNKVRMSFSQWRNFAGICGHQHVPENVHGDPGDFPIDAVIALAKGHDHVVVERTPAPAPKPAPLPAKPTRLSQFHDRLDKEGLIDLNLLRAAVKGGRRGKVKDGLEQLQAIANKLPRR